MAALAVGNTVDFRHRGRAPTPAQSSTQQRTPSCQVVAETEVKESGAPDLPQRR
jgi:hypothetical protein